MALILILLAFFGPRTILVLLWIFTNRLSVLPSGLIGVLGFLLVPWTTLAYIIGMSLSPDIIWLFIVIGIIFDLGSVYSIKLRGD